MRISSLWTSTASRRFRTPWPLQRLWISRRERSPTRKTRPAAVSSTSTTTSAAFETMETEPLIIAWVAPELVLLGPDGRLIRRRLAADESPTRLLTELWTAE